MYLLAAALNLILSQTPINVCRSVDLPPPHTPEKPISEIFIDGKFRGEVYLEDNPSRRANPPFQQAFFEILEGKTGQLQSTVGYILKNDGMIFDFDNNSLGKAQSFCHAYLLLKGLNGQATNTPSNLSQASQGPTPLHHGKSNIDICESTDIPPPYSYGSTVSNILVSGKTVAHVVIKDDNDPAAGLIRPRFRERYLEFIEEKTRKTLGFVLIRNGALYDSHENNIGIATSHCHAYRLLAQKPVYQLNELGGQVKTPSIASPPETTNEIFTKNLFIPPMYRCEITTTGPSNQYSLFVNDIELTWLTFSNTIPECNGPGIRINYVNSLRVAGSLCKDAGRVYTESEFAAQAPEFIGKAENVCSALYQIVRYRIKRVWSTNPKIIEAFKKVGERVACGPGTTPCHLE